MTVTLWANQKWIGILLMLTFILTGCGESVGTARGPATSNMGTHSTVPMLTNTTVLNAINNIDPAVMLAVNRGGLENPLVATHGSPTILKGPTGKPEFFYDGAEYCPYCAAEHWSIVGCKVD